MDKFCIKYEKFIEEYDDIRNPVTDELEHCDECELYFECMMKNKELGRKIEND